MNKALKQLKNWLLPNNKLFFLKRAKQSILFCAFLQCSELKAQQIANYVSNGGFEEHYTCLQQIISVAKNWRTIDSSLFNAVLYYSTCYPNVPSGGLTYQWPHSGQAYGLASFLCQPPECNPNAHRGYFRNRLKSNLQNGKTYCVKFYVNISDPATYGIDGIGAYFGNNSIDTITKCNIPLTYIIPQVQNPNGNIITDTMNWTLITGTFVANGTEKHLIIGNFKSDAATNKVLINPTNLPTIGADVLLDDVSCIDIDLPASAGTDTYCIPGNTVYIGRPRDVGIDEACTWYNITNTLTPIATGVAGLTVAPIITSTYIVKQDICGSIKYDTVIVSQTAVGITEQEAIKNNFHLFPNPSIEILNIEFTLDIENEFNGVLIYNNLGQLIREEEIIFKNKKTAIKTNDLQNGVYFLKIAVGNFYSVNKKFIIAK